MNHQLKEFIKHLKEAALELQPLAEGRTAGSLSWDGTHYVEASCRSPNPYALAWWSTLNAIANLLESQGALPTDAQISYLYRLLFGGMGSLNDLYLEDSDSLAARDINRRLDQIRTALFKSLKAIRESVESVSSAD